MKHLDILPVDLKSIASEYQALATAMTDIPWHALAEASWKASFPEIPKVRFQAAYGNQHLYLHYDVAEEFVKAQYIRPNENVWEDSCVEFFISFDQKATYFNAEFNVLGTGLIGYGPAVKEERQRLSVEQILQVDTFTQVRTIQGKKTWQIILAIPLAILGQKQEELVGQYAFANFYKCGDGLPNPHFISWNFIDHPKPNFHLPAYFGKVYFKP